MSGAHAQRPDDCRKCPRRLQTVQEMKWNKRCDQPKGNDGECLKSRKRECAGEVEQSENVGQKSEPASRLESAQRVKEEEQEIDETEEGCAGRAVERGDAGVVRVESPVQHLGGMKSDVGVVQREFRYWHEEV